MKERTYDFLVGLNPSLDEDQGSILGLKPRPFIDEIFAEIRREEHRKSIMLGTNSSQPLESMAMAIKSFAKKNRPLGANIVVSLITQMLSVGSCMRNL